MEVISDDFDPFRTFLPFRPFRPFRRFRPFISFRPFRFWRRTKMNKTVSSSEKSRDRKMRKIIRAYMKGKISAEEARRKLRALEEGEKIPSIERFFKEIR